MPRGPSTPLSLTCSSGIRPRHRETGAPKSLDAMFTPFKGNYGYGWMIDKQFGLTALRARRRDHGLRDDDRALSREKLLVVALAIWRTRPSARLATDLAAIVLGRRYVVPREPKVAKLDPAVYDAYAGRYEADVSSKEKETTQVSRDGSRLMCEPAGKAKFVLTPESDTLFYIRALIPRPGSSRTRRGRCANLVLIEDGHDLMAKRLPAEVHH